MSVARALIAVTAVAVLVAVAFVAAATPARAEPSQTAAPVASSFATPAPSASPSPAPGFEEQGKPALWDVIGRVRYAISQWFADLVTSALRPVFGLLGRTVFATPPLADNPRIADLWRFSLGIADAALLLFVLAGAGIVMASGGFASQLTAKELLPRLLVAAGAANVSLLLVRQMISLSNALSEAMLGAALDPSEVSGRMMESLAAAAVTNPFLALFALAIVIIAILVLVAYVVRIAAIVILVTGAPLMLAGHSLSHTEGFARAWWRATLALLTAPVLQSMLLAATFRVFLSADGVLGLPSGGGLIDLLVIGCLLYLLFKIPFWALGTAFSGAGARAVSQAKRAARAAAQAVWA